MAFPLQGSSGLTMTMDSVDVVIGVGDPAFILLDSSFDYCINGVVYRSQDFEFVIQIEQGTGIDPRRPNEFVPVQPGEACSFSIFIDSGRDATVAQGQIVDFGSPTFNFPPPPDGKAIVGGFVVRNPVDGGGTWTPGTSSLAVIDFQPISFAVHPGKAIQMG